MHAAPAHGRLRQLYERGQFGLAALYVLLSVALSVAGLFAGLAVVRNLF